jgi:hypothetical protein
MECTDGDDASTCLIYRDNGMLAAGLAVLRLRLITMMESPK